MIWKFCCLINYQFFFCSYTAEMKRKNEAKHRKKRRRNWREKKSVDKEKEKKESFFRKLKIESMEGKWNVIWNKQKKETLEWFEWRNEMVIFLKEPKRKYIFVLWQLLKDCLFPPSNQFPLHPLFPLSFLSSPLPHLLLPLPKPNRQNIWCWKKNFFFDQLSPVCQSLSVPLFVHLFICLFVCSFKQTSIWNRIDRWNWRERKKKSVFFLFTDTVFYGKAKEKI